MDDRSNESTILSRNAEVFYPEWIATEKRSEQFSYSKKVRANKNPFK